MGYPRSSGGRLDNENDPYDYTWAGDPVPPGLPIPGTWYGFAGTLAGSNIPAADAFLLGLIWFLVALGLVGVCLVVFEYVLEGLVLTKRIKEDRLKYFRAHWTEFLNLAVARTLITGFFMLTTLALLQLTFKGPIGSVAVTAVVLALIILLVGGSSPLRFATVPGSASTNS